MNTTRDWEKPVRRFELLMRLKSFPVAFKLLEKKEEINSIPFLRRMKHKSTLCQLINLVRNFDWTVGADVNDFLSVMCPSIIGMADVPEYMKDGTFRSLVWVKTKEDGKKYENGIPRIPFGKYKAVALAPLVYNPFDPDIVLIYANPAQMMLLINALQFENYEVMEFFCVGESSCSDAIARCYLKGKPYLTIPCYGERRYGHAQDEDLVMAIPVGLMDKALNGLEELYKRGIRYPISYAGAEVDVLSAFPAAYGSQPTYETPEKKKSKRMLLGVTGGIASGKSTVAGMLEELGAPMIDFDELSRVVQQPDKPAWKDIVSFFGEQILHKDRTLNREKLREIVFSNKDKRKKLESFTHPRIGVEFQKRVDQYTKDNPDAIIQVVIPLLIETNMQGMFDHLLLVYVNEEEQFNRLIKRDKNSKELTMRIIQSQMPVDEKKAYCDLLIDNSGPIEKTREQVNALWKKLKKIQREQYK